MTTRRAPPPPPTEQVLHLAGVERTSGRGRYAPCPKCGHGVSDDGRGTVHLGHGGKTWRCFACMTEDEKNLDGYDLIAFAQFGVRANALGPRFREVLEILGRAEPLPPREHPVAAATPLPRVPEAELRDLFRRCAAPHAAPAVASFLAGRKIDPARAPAGVLPPDFSAPWWPTGWSTTWPLVVPAVDAEGRFAGLHARAIGDAPSKTRWPRGVDCRGLLFADPKHARVWLRGGLAPERVVVFEGLTDFLWGCAQGMDVAILGIESGSAEAFSSLPWKSGCKVIVATDPDRAGDGYAARIVDALPTHVIPYRAPLAA